MQVETLKAMIDDICNVLCNYIMSFIVNNENLMCLHIINIHCISVTTKKSKTISMNLFNLGFPLTVNCQLPSPFLGNIRSTTVFSLALFAA